MGFLYPWRYIRHERIPTRENFADMQGIIMGALHTTPGVVAAAVYGSVARGDHTSRSDMDVAVVCRSAEFSRVQKLVGEMRVRAAGCNVVMNDRVFSVSDARAGKHPFGPSYRYTMRDLARSGQTIGLLHQWFLCPFADSIRTEMIHKLERNLLNVSRNTQRYLFQEQPDPEWIEHWLEKTYGEGERPMHLYMRFARWMLWFEQGKVKDDSKEAVLNSFLRDHALTRFHEDFLCLHELDHEYDDLLERACASKVRRGRYRKAVRRIISQTYKKTTSLLSRAYKWMQKSGRSDPIAA